MQHQVGLFEITGNPQAGAERGFVHQQLVVVVAQARADVPFPQIDLVLNKRGLLEVPFSAAELEGRRGVLVKLGEVRNDVAEFFVELGGVGLKTRFPFIAALVNRKRPLEIAFIEAAVLEGDHRGRERIGIERLFVRPHHAAQLADDVGREDVLVGSDPHGFGDAPVLALPGSLLDLLIGHFESGDRTGHRQAHSVFVGQVALVAQREIAGASVIRVVLYRRAG